MDAIEPNLVQTLEGQQPLFMVDHLRISPMAVTVLVATKMAVSLSDYAITEAGFGADLGAEKFLDIKS